MKKIMFLFFFIIKIYFYVHSTEFQGKSTQFSVNIPEGWEIIDQNSSSIYSFQDPGMKCVFQVFLFKPDTFKDSESIYQHIIDQFQAKGDYSPFKYESYDAVMADLSFHTSQYKVRGYFVFINGDEADYALLSFSQASYYNQYHDYMLSCLDSFSIQQSSRMHPGPVSQFYFFDNKKGEIDFSLNFFDKSVGVKKNDNEIDTTKMLIEREARILVAYTKKENRINAWKRMYQMIYRDNYSRLAPIAAKLNSILTPYSSLEKARVLVRWIQNFKYTRTRTLTDLTPPLESLYTYSGDCDSRSLLLMLLFHHIGIDSILLVSEKYAHAAIAVNLDIKGKSIKYHRKNYFYVELTKVSDIGVVPAKVSDLSGWIIMDLY